MRPTNPNPPTERWLLAGRLRALIARRYTCYRAAAESLGVRYGSLLGYARGRIVPTPERLRQILDGLGATGDDLLAADPIPDRPLGAPRGRPRKDRRDPTTPKSLRDRP